jgi:hypothetical protein
LKLNNQLTGLRVSQQLFKKSRIYSGFSYA